ncbi:hypothetical protein BRE01_01160 [Brevibacillus reuszeri]|uniref:YcdB/YcdC repeated domain-containing protein n=1 Tax=Brevibacillus reuszeri TaxID=54915 RepID=A0A0K9YRG5_9BACL|nr:YcdB/YcdC domain-containing protein [Brevibacillus reuszeri]KNB71313.1 hypothetical protein ADS79_21130 [Brevibacillus reuszeri]MED1857756.1 hypothetical protein [Brevibacillus reuszeri]GED66414.1 hypothetical protein BRE01_01160 [Brevibacillus reuszeri]
MDVDKELREAVRVASRQTAEQVSFSSALAGRIQKEVANQKKARRKTAVMSGTIAACLAAAVWVGQQQGMFTMEGTGASQTTITEQTNTQVKNKVTAQEAFAPILGAVPELQGLRLEERGNVGDIKQVALLKGDRYEGEFSYDATTGQIEWYRYEKEESREGKLPEMMVAQQKAITFLQSVLGVESKQYAPISTHKLTDEGMRNGTWMNVTFQKEQEGARIPFDIISVQIDSKGQVAFFGRTNKEEQALLGKLTKSLPELNPSPTLDNKSMYYGGFEIMLGNADHEEWKQASISMTGKAEDLRAYRLIQEGATWKEAPEALAKTTANDFLQDMVGADSKNYRYAYKNDTVEYQRYYNDLPVMNDTIRMSVNQAGRVVYYSKEAMKKHELASFPDAISALSEEKAIKEMEANIKLNYVQLFPVKRDERTRQIIQTRSLLEYTMSVSTKQLGQSPSLGWYIDAANGKIAYSTGNNGLDYDRRNEAKVFSVQPSATRSIVKTKEEAKSLLNKQFGVQVDGFTYNEHAGSHPSTGQVRKSYVWTDKNQKRYEVGTDEKSGRVLGIEMPRQGNQLTVKREEAQQAALEMLATYIDPAVKEVQLAEVIEPGGATPVSSGNWGFEFFMSKDGIPVLDNEPNEAYIVTVDPTSGKANGFENRRGTESHVELPDATSVISKEKAVEQYLRAMPLKLVYLLKNEDDQWLERPILAYIPWSYDENAGKHLHIDALTGEITGEP